jgi:phi13 family phage major tail protein
MPSSALQEIVEYRGVEGLVAAEVLVDDNETNTAGEGQTANHGYVTGDVFAIAGVAEISKTTDSSSEAHYYDNIPAVVVSNTSSDEVTISASAIPLDVLATITGQNYDQTTGALIEGPRNLKYFAIGYKTKKTNGDEMYVWRYKGTFNIPDQTNSTENDSTDANGQEIVFTGISTTHKFTKNTDSAGNPRGAKALVVDVAKGLADVTTFFNTVTTPDSLQAVSG